MVYLHSKVVRSQNRTEQQLLKGYWIGYPVTLKTNYSKLEKFFFQERFVWPFSSVVQIDENAGIQHSVCNNASELT